MSDIKLSYVANARLPSRKAHTYQIVQMCDAFAESGCTVELVVPDRTPPANAPEDTAEYYDSPLEFEVTRLPCLDALRYAPRVPTVVALGLFYLQAITFMLSAVAYTARSDQDVLYSRALLFTVCVAPLFGSTVVVELHRKPSREWIATLLGKAFDRLRAVVVISEGLAEAWDEYTDATIFVEPDGVCLDRFEVDADVERLREELDLPQSATIACYTGSLQLWKGVDTLALAAASLPEDFVVCLVGGTESQRESLLDAVGTLPDSVRLVGHVTPERVPEYLLASDVLVIPNTAEVDISAEYTSPLKLFEYMAAERPIVATDIPSLRSILDDETAFFAPPDDPAGIADAIQTAARSQDRFDRAKAARSRVTDYTWTARATRIRDRILNQRCSTDV